jgi:diguanylate cyclase (GGDEF)-like protein/PAS domain S-box-containing protein
MPSVRNLSEVFVQTLEQAIDGVVVIDRDNRIILFNRAAERLWGRAREEVLGQNVGALVPAAIRSGHDGYIEANRHGGLNKIVGTSRDVPIERRDGRQRWGSMSISRIEADGEIFYTAFIKDVTRQHEESEQLRLLSLVVDQTDNAILITDDLWRIVYVNQGFTRVFGYSLEQAMGHSPSSLIANELDQATVGAVRAQLLGGQPYHAEEIGRSRNGRRIWCSVAANPVFDDQGRLANTVSVLTDITNSKMHEVLQHRMLEAMVREEPLEALMELACREVERIAPEVVASIARVDDEGRIHPLAAPSLPAGYRLALEGLPIDAPAVGGTWVAATGLRGCWSIPIKAGDGRALGVLAFHYREERTPSRFHRRLADVVLQLCALALEREESRSRINQLAFYDSLTGLPNRSLLQARAGQALLEAERQGKPLAVLFIDLDRFKQVNDSLGHPAGDALLCLVARRLQESRRGSDIVGRLSGDEFVMVLPGCGSGQISVLLEQLKTTLGQPCRIANTTLTPSASIGISLFPQDGRDMGTLIHRADMAMYQAKHSGRGRFSVYSHDLNQLAQERLTLENALREALRRGGLHLHYQPQVRLADGSLHGVEALARWSDPRFGDVPPARFIALAEECGLIGELGRWAIREACRQLAAWRRQGLAVPAISVNLSPSDFHDPDLPAMLARSLGENRLDAADLTLEITESVIMDSNPGTLKILGEVHALGVRLAMDDFGTGYSSLGYLHRLPIQELKLDRSFVRDLEHDPTSRALSDAVIRIGQSLRLNVVAEGIEDQAQHDILLRQGYAVAQGYLFSRPLPAAELENWLRTRQGEPGAG